MAQPSPTPSLNPFSTPPLDPGSSRHSAHLGSPLMPDDQAPPRQFDSMAPTLEQKYAPHMTGAPLEEYRLLQPESASRARHFSTTALAAVLVVLGLAIFSMGIWSLVHMSRLGPDADEIDISFWARRTMLAIMVSFTTLVPGASHTIHVIFFKSDEDDTFGDYGSTRPTGGSSSSSLWQRAMAAVGLKSTGPGGAEYSQLNTNDDGLLDSSMGADPSGLASNSSIQHSLLEDDGYEGYDSYQRQ
ncbi:hypothetical protein H696_01501 [Fonticula alba]|uniref:Transmembrane protein n=1 Tax=Fonticula alba TaxID=691883 RepID=A0A058ZCI6_FONAL|nr:hypothetical protein H696_01501 [Fonticula alba]KCV72094.1 hypothetical protein H696_01501 [Fonticula alba]|eukprot:XP_009493672.1 hypothetical protein H696_01501 [Fonticula alba]